MEFGETHQAAERSGAALADLLEARCEEIILRWKLGVRRHLPSEDFPEPQLVDSLPAFLCEMFASLREGVPRRGTAEPSRGSLIAEEHGKQRFECGVDLLSLIWEYGVLREVLLDIIEEAGHPLSSAELRILTRSLDTGVSESVRRYTVEAQQALDESAEFEQQLLGIVSHDLRNPINAILLSASSLLRREELDLRTSRAALRIHSSADRAARLIRDLLDFTQARMGGIPVQPRAVDLHALCRQVVDEVQAAHPERKLTVETSGDGKGEWDPDRLAQVLTNLLVNALAYSSAESHVSVATRGEPGAVLIIVNNRGEPISPELLPQLFEPMRRGVGRTSQPDRSIGLGLFIVKHIVEAHGGSVDVRSTESEGTTFTVRLPRGRH